MCVILMAFYNKFFCARVICKCPDSVAAFGYYLHSHLYMAQCKRCLPDLFSRSGCTCIWHFILIMYGFCQHYTYSKFQIVLYFRLKHLCGQILKLVNTYFIFHTYLYILLISVCVWRMFTFGKGEL